MAQDPGEAGLARLDMTSPMFFSQYFAKSSKSTMSPNALQERKDRDLFVYI